jgi:hypothetical protein
MGLWFRVYNLGFVVYGVGFRVWGFRVWGVGSAENSFMAKHLGFRV